jgi:ParB-like chromosome segregation protein Spo0J
MVELRTPITVRRIEKERDGVSTTVLALVAGGYRLEAFKSLELKRIPAFVIEGDKSEARILQLIENLYGRPQCSSACRRLGGVDRACSN